jgi:hypothetical protein
MVGCLAFAAPSWAAPKTVCSSGCAYTTIKGAVEAASSGATITVGPGSYYENIAINKALTLKDSGASTVIYPSVSQPVCPELGDGSTLCGGSASIIIEVAASNVTIENLKLDGNNPKLTSGHVTEGQDIDARGGIVENYEAGSFNDLIVKKVSIVNIWERALYASSEGSGFVFSHDTLQNVQGEEESIAVFDFGGSGEITDDTITNVGDAIAANWSRGLKIEGNKIRKAAAGIHTDNNGGFGGVADVIKGNEVLDCTNNGYGIFTFASRVATPTVEANKVSGCDVAFAAFGSEGVVGTDVSFVDNRADGAGAATTEPEGPTAMYLSTSLLGYGTGPMTASVTGNRFEKFANGLVVSQTEGNQATVTAHQNEFKEVTLGALGETGTVVKAEENWWGCKQGPNGGPKCSKVEGTVTDTPFLSKK